MNGNSIIPLPAEFDAHYAPNEEDETALPIPAADYALSVKRVRDFDALLTARALAYESASAINAAENNLAEKRTNHDK